MKTSDLPPWLHDLLVLSADRKAFERAVLRVLRPHWNASHSRKQSGPSPLSQDLVYAETATVLTQLTPHMRQTLTWTKLIAQVRGLIKAHQTGDMRLGDPYSSATIRKHVRRFIYMNLRVNEIPPRLLDARQLWMKECDNTLAAMDCALQEWKSGLPFIKDGYTRLEDYYLPLEKI